MPCGVAGARARLPGVSFFEIQISDALSTRELSKLLQGAGVRVVLTVGRVATERALSYLGREAADRLF